MGYLRLKALSLASIRGYPTTGLAKWRVVPQGCTFIPCNSAKARGETIDFKMWLFPGLTWASIAFIVAVLVVMALREDRRAQIIATALLSIGVVAAGLLVHRKRQAAGRVALDN